MAIGDGRSGDGGLISGVPQLARLLELATRARRSLVAVAGEVRAIEIYISHFLSYRNAIYLSRPSGPVLSGDAARKSG